MMKKTFVYLLVVMLVLSGFFLSVSGEKTVENTSQLLIRGEIFYVGGTGEGNYSNIQDAINNASDSDTVYVYDDSSPYFENVIVDKSLLLIGEDKETTIIDGGTLGDCILIQSDGVLVEGFTLTHATNEYYGIRISSDENIIRGNIITHNMIGIHLLHVNFNTIDENEITQNYYGGIYQYSCDDTIISHNQISGVTQTAGISILYQSHRALVTLNTISDNNCGINMFRSNDNTLLNNNIIGNGFGISLDLASHNLIKQNNIQKNLKPVLWSGLSWHLAQERWYRNTFDGNYWGKIPYLIKPIFGTLLLVMNVQDNGSNGLGCQVVGILPIIKFDLHPAHESYDIPGGT